MAGCAGGVCWPLGLTVLGDGCGPNPQSAAASHCASRELPGPELHMPRSVLGWDTDDFSYGSGKGSGATSAVWPFRSQVHCLLQGFGCSLLVAAPR